MNISKAHTSRSCMSRLRRRPTVISICEYACRVKVQIKREYRKRVGCRHDCEKRLPITQQQETLRIQKRNHQPIRTDRSSEGLTETRGSVLHRIRKIEICPEFSHQHGEEIGDLVGDQHVVKPAIYRDHPFVRKENAQHLSKRETTGEISCVDV